MDASAFAPQIIGGQDKPQIPKLQLFENHITCPPGKGADSRQQLSRFEGFCHIIIGAVIQPVYLVAHIVFGGKEQHGCLDPLFPHLLHNREAVHLGQHYIQYYHVIISIYSIIQTVCSGVNHIAQIFGFQHNFTQCICQPDFIFYNQYVHLSSPQSFPNYTFLLFEFQ